MVFTSTSPMVKLSLKPEAAGFFVPVWPAQRFLRSLMDKAVSYHFLGRRK